MTNENREYLGDAVYIEPDRYLNGVKLYTSDGISELNTIFLDEYVIQNLLNQNERKLKCTDYKKQPK